MFLSNLGLYGQNEREAALIDMINDQQEDMRVAYARMIYKEYVCIVTVSLLHCRPDCYKIADSWYRLIGVVLDRI